MSTSEEPADQDNGPKKKRKRKSKRKSTTEVPAIQEDLGSNEPAPKEHRKRKSKGTSKTEEPAPAIQENKGGRKNKKRKVEKESKA